MDPTLETEPARAAPGEAFAVRGDGFLADCNDYGEGRQGESRREAPDREVRVEFRQRGRAWKLATLAADNGYVIESELTVPAYAEPGRAVVVASGDYGPVEERFTVLGEGRN